MGLSHTGSEPVQCEWLYSHMILEEYNERTHISSIGLTMAMNIITVPSNVPEYNQFVPASDVAGHPTLLQCVVLHPAGIRPSTWYTHTVVQV